MIQPGRKYSATDGYRYGFNGKENDNDVKGEGNQQDYGMRIYDPRLGRFLSVDPLMQSYPWYTPYQFAGNMPTIAIDIDGNEPEYMIDKNGKLTEPVIVLLEAAFGGYGTDWSESLLRKSTWKVDKDLKEGDNLAYTKKIHRKTIYYNQSVDTRTFKDFSEEGKFEQWLELISHEEYHVMQNHNWGIVSSIVTFVYDAFQDYEDKVTESTAFDYGNPLDFGGDKSETTKLILSANEESIYSIIKADMDEGEKLDKLRLIGLNYRKSVIEEEIKRKEKSFNKKLDQLGPLNDIYKAKLDDVNKRIEETKKSMEERKNRTKSKDP